MKTCGFALALCALGLEKVCQNEIEHLGLGVEHREPGRVRFALPEPLGLSASLMRANLCLRTAERVLIEVGRFRAADFDQLFESVRSLPWELYFHREDKLVIERVRSHRSRLSAQTSIQSLTHKAVYERLGSVYKIRRLAETGMTRSLRVYLEDDYCILGLDTSGEALHKRGYRLSGGVAPLKETIAAAILFLSGWNRRQALLDPFCGSGTIAIEAALYALDRAPGLGRSFAFQSMPFAAGDEASRRLADEKAAAEARIRSDVEVRIAASDIDSKAIELARANADRAGVASYVEFSIARAEDACPIGERGCLLCNPPYGERLGSLDEAHALYRRLGGLAERFTAWGLGFITNSPDFGEYFGTKAPRPHKIVNGAEEQYFHWYPPQRRQ